MVPSRIHGPSAPTYIHQLNGVISRVPNLDSKVSKKKTLYPTRFGSKNPKKKKRTKTPLPEGFQFDQVSARSFFAKEVGSCNHLESLIE